MAVEVLSSNMNVCLALSFAVPVTKPTYTCIKQATATYTLKIKP